LSWLSVEIGLFFFVSCYFNTNKTLFYYILLFEELIFFLHWTYNLFESWKCLFCVILAALFPVKLICRVRVVRPLSLRNLFNSDFVPQATCNWISFFLIFLHFHWLGFFSSLFFKLISSIYLTYNCKLWWAEMSK